MIATNNESFSGELDGINTRFKKLAEALKDGQDLSQSDKDSFNSKVKELAKEMKGINNKVEDIYSNLDSFTNADDVFVKLTSIADDISSLRLNLKNLDQLEGSIANKKKIEDEQNTKLENVRDILNPLIEKHKKGIEKSISAVDSQINKINERLNNEDLRGSFTSKVNELIAKKEAIQVSGKDLDTALINPPTDDNKLAKYIDEMISQKFVKIIEDANLLQNELRDLDEQLEYRVINADQPQQELASEMPETC